mgnify:CR=1 FL=1
MVRFIPQYFEFPLSCLHILALILILPALKLCDADDLGGMGVKKGHVKIILEALNRLKSEDDVENDQEKCCPITRYPLVDPVKTADGHVYERSAIETWLQTHDRSPLTNEILPHKSLISVGAV